MEHQDDERDVVQAEESLGEPLVVPRQATKPRRPAERPFHHPTTRQPYPFSLRLGQ